MKVRVQSNKSYEAANLTTGVHPAVLVGVAQGAIPDGWAMGDKHTHLWRWHFLAWPDKEACERGDEPEELSPISSPVISPASKFQASKAYTYLSELFGPEFVFGAEVDFDLLFPAPCQVSVWSGMKNERRVCNLEHIIPPEKWQDDLNPAHPRIEELRKEIEIENEVFDSFSQVSAVAKAAPATAAEDDDIPF